MRRYVPPGQARERPDKCRHDCCWTPYAGVCARDRDCGCHEKEGDQR